MNSYLSALIQEPKASTQPLILPEGTKQPRFMAESSLHTRRVLAQRSVSSLM